ncbi:MAG: L,D-transpeptidase [Phototrophicales bacterium]|nr:L,D-transpeptidase [Phototrophicales bacterium]
MIKSRLLILLFLLLMSLPLASVSLANTQDCQDGCSSLQAYGLSADEILAYVQPTFERPAVDYNLMNDRRYMRVNGIMEVFDAPNGNFVRMQNAGYNYVTALGEQDGWVRINNNEWVRKDILEDSNGFLSSFSGIFLDGEFPKYPVAWSLNNVYPSKVPGGSPVESNGLTRRYTLLTIYASVMIDGWEWYQIGVDKWMVQTHVGKVSPLDRPAEIDTQRWISIDLFEQVVIVFDGTQPIFATLIASGLPQWQTREGMYHIYFRKSRDDMTGGVVGDDYYLIEEVPWTMYFDQGRAFHGAYWHDGFGFRRSHGCVNLSLTDAHWLYRWVAEEFESFVSPNVEEGGPAVWVYHSSPYR